eukprot:365548-Chlamydomonas_euryale.AAC.4
MASPDLNKVLCLLAETLEIPHEQNVPPDSFELFNAALKKLGIENLLPKNAEYVDIDTICEDVQPGDHLLVRKDGSTDIFHHGIYVGQIEGKRGHYVIDMFGTTQADAKVQLRSITAFVRGDKELAVMRYKGDDDEKRERSVRLAMDAMHDPANVPGIYNLLGDNCEHFATWCRTMRWDSKQVQRIGEKVIALALELVVRVISANTGSSSASSLR